MWKMLGIGFAIVLVGLLGFSVYTDSHPEAAHASETKLEPVDHALGLCEEWTQKNSKLAMGEITEEHRITGAKIPADHGLVEINYRAKVSGLLMVSRCEYATVAGEAVLVKAESRAK